MAASSRQVSAAGLRLCCGEDGRLAEAQRHLFQHQSQDHAGPGSTVGSHLPFTKYASPLPGQGGMVTPSAASGS